MAASIAREEVADVLRRIMRGEIEATCEDTHQCGFIIRAAGHVITIFDDASSLDYVEVAEWADGRVATFDEWWGAGDPLDLLTYEETARLERVLGINP